MKRETFDDKLKMIVKLQPSKTYGHDKISICIIKICSASIWEPLKFIFNHGIDNGIYPYEWKKANVLPIHKKVTNKP